MATLLRFLWRRDALAWPVREGPRLILGSGEVDPGWLEHGYGGEVGVEGGVSGAVSLFYRLLSGWDELEVLKGSLGRY